jgi:hypothetical protein
LGKGHAALPPLGLHLQNRVVRGPTQKFDVHLGFEPWRKETQTARLAQRPPATVRNGAPFHESALEPPDILSHSVPLEVVVTLALSPVASVCLSLLPSAAAHGYLGYGRSHLEKGLPERLADANSLLRRSALVSFWKGLGGHLRHSGRAGGMFSQQQADALHALGGGGGSKDGSSSGGKHDIVTIGLGQSIKKVRARLEIAGVSSSRPRRKPRAIACVLTK